MCTVTFIARRRGYRLGMNRDEKLTRGAARPPAQHCLENRNAIFPSEPNGGTWIGVNDAGATFALINWYSVPTNVAGTAVSRGEIVKRSLRSDSPEQLDETLSTISLDRVNPFRLLGVFGSSRVVVEWRWDLQRRQRLGHSWQSNVWISSGFDEVGVQQGRGETFAEAVQEISAGSTSWLRRLHGSHAPEAGPYSTCMHRVDAATVSYTEITVARETATLLYTPGSPCCTAPMTAHHLRLAGSI
jgi:hypothetical protein